MTRISLAIATSSLLSLLIGCGTASSQNEPVKIELGEDKFVIRSMQIIEKSGEPIPRLKMISGFDAATGSLRAQNTAGEIQNISLSGIARIKFTQEVQSQSPMAQAAACEIKVQKGTQQQIAIPIEKLQIKDGALVMESALMPLPPEGQEWKWEVIAIIPQEAGDAFSMDVEPVRYEEKCVGGGGSSGTRKGSP